MLGKAFLSLGATLVDSYAVELLLDMPDHDPRHRNKLRTCSSLLESVFGGGGEGP